MGTPEFSVPALRALHRADHDVILVVTQPDRRKGRGRKFLPPPVKKTALEFGYDLIQPESPKSDEFIKQVKSLEPDLFIVVAYGHILTEKILRVPSLGAVNIHASLLPKYRGPAPIQRAVIDGEKESGVTIMYMDKGMDTGDMLLSGKTLLTPDETAATLHDRLSVLGADLLLETLESFETNKIKPVPQEHENATYAPMLKKEDGHIDWEQSAETIERLVRGMDPWPGAFTFHEDKRLKIFKVRVARPQLLSGEKESYAGGTVMKGFTGELRVATGKGDLDILEIQGASGKRLSIGDYLRGYELPPGSILK